MKCPTCFVGDLHFYMRGVLRFETDEKGRPTGTADIDSSNGEWWMECDTCHYHYGIGGWQADGKGAVTLEQVEPRAG